MDDQDREELARYQAELEWSMKPIPILDGEHYLGEGAWHTRIESQSFPGKIIRRQGPFRQEKDIAGPLKLSQGLFEELAVNYGIIVPDFSTRVIQNSEGAYFGDIIVDRVSGKPLVDVIKEGDGKLTIEDLDKFGETFARYYIDKKRSGGTALSDLRIDQFIWGTIEGDTTERAYFIDLDPLYGEYISGSDLGQLWRSVKESEGKLGSKLELTRRKMLELIQEFVDSNNLITEPFVKDIRNEILSTS